MRTTAVMIATAMLAGCAMPGDDIFRDMANNQFMDVQPESVPAGMDGHWSGAAGPSMMTLDLRQDGGGTICTVYGATNSLHAVKYSNGEIHTQGGTRIVISQAGERLAASYPYKHGPAFEFHRDDDLSKAAPYCRDSM